jgi:hypothetical protein
VFEGRRSPALRCSASPTTCAGCCARRRSS